MDSTKKIHGDLSPLEEFSARAKVPSFARQYDTNPNGVSLSMHIFEWDRGVSNGEGVERDNVKSMHGLDRSGHPDVRVM
jgi:hypothetical protein